MADDTELKTEPICKLDLGENGGPHVFYSADEMIKWINDELAVWEELFSEKNQVAVEPNTNPNEQLRNHKQFVIDNLNSLRNQGHQATDVDRQIADVFKGRIEPVFKKKQRIHSTSSTGQLILSLAQGQDKREALWLWWLATSETVNLNGVRIQRAMFDAAIKLEHLTGTYSTVAAERDALAELRKQWQKILDDETARIQEQTTKAKENREGTDLTIRDFAKERSDAVKSLADLVGSFETEKNRIAQQYREYATLSEPNKYWIDKEKQHAAAKEFSGRWALAYGVFVFLMLLFGLPWTVQKNLPFDVGSMLKEGSITEATAASLMSSQAIVISLRFLAGALLLAWPLRILIRNYLSHAHLAIDAKERTTVIGTFLALADNKELRNESALRHQILKTAMENIFRHSEDGIVRDDAMPMSDAVKKAIGIG